MTGLLPPAPSPQLTLWHLLDRATGVPDVLQDLVHAHVACLVPDGASTWCRRILTARLLGEHAFEALVDTLDGGCIELRFAGPPGHGCYSLAMPSGHDMLIWQGPRRGWRRQRAWYPRFRPTPADPAAR